MKIEDIIRRYKKKIERKTEAMNDYKQSNNIELLTAVSVCENEIEEAELIISALELSKAKEEGRLVVLPCKVGDVVYRLNGIYSWDIEHIEIYGDEIIFVDDSDNIFRLDDIGKTVFLTRESAEKALGGG